MKEKIRQQQEKQKSHHDVHSRACTFKQDDLVLVRSFNKKEPLWLSGVITQLVGTNSCKIQVNGNRIVCLHADHIRAWQPDCNAQIPSDDSDDALSFPVSSQAATSTSTLPTLR